ncbi:ABC transporter ATP-binding protein/permease [Corynebacterium sp. 153RC1]|uniref:ABC transporter ATP-binding protein n=1 Tax=unclassified Corynebacterium TaxID=2624378 RepID=UPI00211CBE0A|nr:MULTISPECIES: ABC transporter ATP-binding protein [unclassified Corynebacterium]MCQ9371672.1 ABC transporter ATP-binding protein/permease [Corynebacterium sp. 35RC1]MCQ9352374.1 ABC transporter ATP-binding protein/permease [Corynebacterium sp. 209RC1]MCQ9354236.1 ABC transporter ATP-binding protein/permease [Corynebacterium sp. 1222RC1]MCQ9356518.1 ABC transporter ATP-binding protein/permease [Corynebacterium sp. 122RC1]MCQ9358898.1 ABC transporter ATP-binding protein/permease [Corynebacter
MKALGKILRSAATLWPYYLGVVVSAVLVAGLALVTPFILKDATDSIVAAVTGERSVEEVSGHVVFLALLLLAAQLGNTVLHNVGGYIGDVMAARLRQMLSTRYFAKLLGMPQRYFDTQVTGTIIARLDRSITSITQAMQALSNNFFPMIVTVIAVLSISAWYYWPLAILLAVIIPIYMWLTAITSKKWQRIEGKKNEQIDLAGGRFAEVIGQVKVVKSFVAEIRELSTFGRRFGDTVVFTREQSRFWHFMDVLRGGTMDLIFFGIYLMLFYRTLHGFFTLGDMVLLIQLVNMARMPMTMMSWVVDTSQRAIAGSKDYFEIMDKELEATVNPQIAAATTASDVPTLDLTPATPLVPVAGKNMLSFQSVDFAYDAGEQVLHNVTFHAKEGEKIALVGESGGGKSTIVNLLLGLYQPQGGVLEVCGHNVAEVSAEALRASVGVVFQEASLFSGTIRENIAYAIPDATEEQVIEVAKRANAHEFISQFQDGYDTLIGERGLRLSGGQKQRIAVARAMLKDAPVLILDEATSALDTKAEIAVQEGLELLMHGRTTVIIAHRLSTIAGVDKIITLKDGHVDEIGSPAELAVSGGIYSELLALTRDANEASKEQLKRFGFSGL